MCVCVKVSYVTSVADLFKVSINACVVTVCYVRQRFSEAG